MHQFNFGASDKTIKEILSTIKQIRVPLYQRHYVWSADQVEDFWEDLKSSSNIFFLGSFVFNTENLDKEKYIEVIDGQQRLITLTIFAAALRDVAASLSDQKLSVRINEEFIGKANFRGESSYFLQCGDSLKGFFEKYIQAAEHDPFPMKVKLKEHRQIIDNYNYFKEVILEEVSEDDDVKKKDLLVELCEKLQDLKVIDIRINAEEDAYTIFETVNARGESLKVADLLKNLIFRQLSQNPKELAIAKEQWERIEANISDAGVEINKFFRHYWLSKYSFISEKNLYREIKNEVKDFKSFLAEIETSSEWYRKLCLAKKEEWRDTKSGIKIWNSLLGIKSMHVSQCYVLLMCLLRNLDKIDFEIRHYFEVIENFTFVYSAVSKFQANKVEKLYSRTAIDIEREVENKNKKHLSGNIQRLMDQLENNLKKIKPSDQVFLEKFKEISYKNSESVRIFIKYILSKVNNYISGGEILLDFDIISIEHLLPKNPNEKMKITHADIREYVNLLGNLTLISDKKNKEASNKSPKDKISVLLSSRIDLNHELAKFLRGNKGKWGEKEILERTNNLAMKAYNYVWN